MQPSFYLTDISGIDFAGRDLSDIDWHGAWFSAENPPSFIGADVTQADFSGAVFVSAGFSEDKENFIIPFGYHDFLSNPTLKDAIIIRDPIPEKNCSIVEGILLLKNIEKFDPINMSHIEELTSEFIRETFMRPDIDNLSFVYCQEAVNPVMTSASSALLEHVIDPACPRELIDSLFEISAAIISCLKIPDWYSWYILMTVHSSMILNIFSRGTKNYFQNIFECMKLGALPLGFDLTGNLVNVYILP